MPKGALYIVGGGLNKSQAKVFSHFIKDAGGGEAKIAFVLSASGSEPDETFCYYRDIFVSLGVKKQNCMLIPLYGPGITDERGENAQTGDCPGLVEAVRGVTGVWFTGGDQYYTSKCFLRPDGTDTALLGEFRRIYENGGVIGGSSAGAAIMSRVMIGGGSNRGLLAQGTKAGYAGYDPNAENESPDSGAPLTLTREGLGFLPGAVVDQHFNRRPRTLRLIEACMINECGTKLGFGVSEDTALVYKAGEYRVLGSAGVFVLDCRGGERLCPGKYRGIVLSALYEGDVINADGSITISREAPEGLRSFQRDYISGAVPDSRIFDDAMDKLLRGDDTSVFTEAGAPCVKGAVVYGTDRETYLVTLKYSRLPKAFGAYCEATGQTSAAFIGLEVDTKAISG